MILDDIRQALLASIVKGRNAVIVELYERLLIAQIHREAGK